MKRLLIMSAVLLTALHQNARAQLSAGAEGWYVKPGTVWFTDSLVLIPATDVALVNTIVTRSHTPVGGGMYGESIKRVYNFSAPFNFSGTAYFYFLDDELNGNSAADLQLAYLDDAGDGTTTSDGISNTYSNYVLNSLDNASIAKLTAVNGGVPLPLSGAGLQAACFADYILLNATVLDNEQYLRYDLERSSDGKAWEPAGSLVATTQRGAADYTYRDINMQFQKRLYRMVLIGKDGKSTYSDTRQVTACTKAAAGRLLAAQQADGSILLHGSNTASLSDARIMDMSGRTVWTAAWAAPKLRAPQLAPGIYLAQAKLNGQVVSVRFIVQ